MKLYPKKLHGIKDLQREKKRLEKQTVQFEKGNIGTEKDNASWADFIPGSNPLMGLAIKMIQGRIAKKKVAKAEVITPPIATEPRKSKLKAIALEFIGGYLKWKAIELAYKAIRHYIQKHKEKKEA